MRRMASHSIAAAPPAITEGRPPIERAEHGAFRDANMPADVACDQLVVDNVEIQFSGKARGHVLAAGSHFAGHCNDCHAFLHRGMDRIRLLRADRRERAAPGVAHGFEGYAP